VLRDVLIDGALPNGVNLTAHVVFASVWTGAAVTRREWYHHAAAVATAVLVALYVAVLFAQLR
jgi:hypothetical protein